MEACQGVEKEVDKVIQKFGSIQSHSERVFDETIMFVDQLRETFAQGTNYNQLLFFFLEDLKCTKEKNIDLK